MLPPEKLCRNHLLGEHFELHKIVGALNKKKNIKGYIDNGLIEIHSINKRHTELIREIKKRKMKHNSPLPRFRKINLGKININKNKKDLLNRCNRCKVR